MNSEKNVERDLLDTTDCLEAISVFRFWKNVLFVLIMMCLLVLQVSFWVAGLDLISKQTAEAEVQAMEVVVEDSPELINEDTKVVDEAGKKIEEAARQVISDVNKPAVASRQQEKPIDFSAILKKEHILRTIKTADFALILLAMAYCLIILFTLKISMVGRLGGINHITRALVLSLFFVVLILPWQEILGPFTAGAIYTPSELMSYVEKYDSASILGKAFYYLRFVGYWLVVLLLLIFAQIRTARWSKATLRRLKVI